MPDLAEVRILKPVMPAYESKPIPQIAKVSSFGVEHDPRDCIRNCPVGKSFTVDTARCRKRVQDAGYSLGVKMTTRKNELGKYDCWRKA